MAVAQRVILHFLVFAFSKKVGRATRTKVEAAAQVCPEGKDLKKSSAKALIELNLFVFIWYQGV